MTFVLIINCPIIVLSFCGNIFYAYCLIFPSRKEQGPKQPLRILLVLIVFYSIFYCVSLSWLLYLLFNDGSFTLFALCLAVLSDMQNSMTCSVWLNFFYYIQIVPSQRASIIWIKRNIKYVVYMALLFSGTVYLVNTALNVTSVIFLTIGHNNTLIVNNFVLEIPGTVLFWVSRLYTGICMCVMMVSSMSTVRYLHRHIRNVAQGSSTLSISKVKGQMRVTITGISQVAIYFLYDIYHFSVLAVRLSSDYFANPLLSFTVSMLYVSGTTLNLGIGQAAFRRRLLNISKKAKAMFSTGFVNRDVIMESVDTRSSI